MQAIILAIGDELVLGQTVDRNSAYLSAELAARGIGTVYHQTVADDVSAIALAMTQAGQSAAAGGVVLVTGGLGPTQDDLTRSALAEAMGVELVRDEASVALIARFFEKFGRPMPKRNEVQAMLPAGSEAIENPRGTAPGIKAILGSARVYVMPGVPREMKGMFEQSVLPELEGMAGSRGAIVTGKVNTFGLGESSLAERLGQLMDRQANPKVGTTVSDGIVSVRIRSEFADATEATAKWEQAAKEVEAKLGAIVFGRDEVTLGEAVVTLLRERGVTVATAESCTGGLIGVMLTDVAGSSGVYRGGWVTYTNEMKVAELGVNAEAIEAEGAVSEPVVRQMAVGAAKKAGADMAVSVSGIAGPGGGTTEKPVGLVYLGLAWRVGDEGGGGWRSQAMRVQLPGDRADVRDRAGKCALQMIRLHLLGEKLDLIGWGTVLGEQEQLAASWQSGKKGPV